MPLHRFTPAPRLPLRAKPPTIEPTLRAAFVRAAGCLVVGCLIAVPARGQSPDPAIQATSIGLRFGTDFDAAGQDSSQMIIGAQLDRRLNHTWHVTASLNFYPSSGDGALWASADVKYRPPIVTEMLYLGTGVTAPAHGARRNRAGVDLVFGTEPQRVGPVRPFVEAKWVIFRSYTSFTLQGGLELTL